MVIVYLLLWITLVACTSTFVLMLVGFVRFRHKWNAKTRDYWYGRVMWAFAGIFLSIEEMIRNAHFTYTLIFVLTAALVTLKGNLQRGPWGYSGD